jgi:hypothetical protein
MTLNGTGPRPSRRHQAFSKASASPQQTCGGQAEPKPHARRARWVSTAAAA